MNSLAASLRRLTAAASLALLASCQPQPASSLPDFADLVETASPSVVNISTVSGPPAEVAGGEDTPFNEFFKKFFGDRDEGAPVEDTPLPQPQSLGSGFILWADGYVLTNRHVVRDAQEVIVKLSDRRQLNAKLIGTDERSDLALLKIDATGLPAVKLGDAKKLRVGEWVLAIGSPFGFKINYSAKARHD